MYKTKNFLCPVRLNHLMLCPTYYVPIYFLQLFFFSVATKMSFYKWQMQCFSLLCDFVNALHKYEKMKRNSCSISKGFIHIVKRVSYRFIYILTMYMFSCWWYDHQCLDIPKLPLTFSSIRKKRHLFNKCIICSSQILFLIFLIDVYL